MADPAFYEDAERSTEAIAEHALLKKRLAEHEEEWIALSEEVEEAMREPSVSQHSRSAILSRSFVLCQQGRKE